IYLGTGMNFWGKIFDYTEEGAITKIINNMKYTHGGRIGFDPF
nr:Mtv-50 gene product {C-terminal, LTR, provirus} [mouse mammary tumor virus, Peptide Partial, 42 aa] [Mouse mammary tumor virus]